MRTLLSSSFAVLVGAWLATAALPASATEVNIIPGNTGAVVIDGNPGVLRAGSPWGPGSTLSDPLTPIDGVFAPETQQWNNGSFWWDQDPSVNASQVSYTMNLDGLFTVDRFVVQSDDNDALSIEYWNGSSFQQAWTVPLAGSFGLVTRDSGVIAPITTNALRITGALPSDGYYAVSEFQAFGQAAAPEPAAWALMIVGFGVMGVALRRSRRAVFAV
jgi:hypothetical protein